MEPREKGNEEVRQRIPQKPAKKGEGLQQLPNGDEVGAAGTGGCIPNSVTCLTKPWKKLLTPSPGLRGRAQRRSKAGTLLMLVGFFGFLHCWLNAFAEMLRFADRNFYKDWWNSTSFSMYYRTWNVVVHDWIYYYIYQDLLWLLRGKAQVVAMFSAFFLSGLVREYVFTLSFGFFYPVTFTFLGIFGGASGVVHPACSYYLFVACGNLGCLVRVVFNFTTHKTASPVRNVLMWTFTYVGHGIMVCLYSQEWYAQVHCPLQERTFWGIVTPRSWSCHT